VAAQLEEQQMSKIHFETVKVEGLDIFYREAGNPALPTILLLHGFPTSSHMFRDLMPLLSSRFHLIAPDYPGFGGSSCPDPKQFDYTFDHLGEILVKFTDAIKLSAYTLYLQDFGGPVGLRLAAQRAERVTGLIIQNANAYIEGVTPELTAILTRLFDERTDEMRAFAAQLFELPYTKRQYLEGVADPSLVSPDAWNHAQWGMDRPGNKEIQYLIHANYASNFKRYDEWHAFFRKYQPPALIVWGNGDFVFGLPGANAYQKDLNNSELHILDEAAHFALETHSEEIAGLIVKFMSARVLGNRQSSD
jgi:pimeloyl-ACP methyl ester carboxylesterase